MSDPFFHPSFRDISNPFEIPTYDTIVESSTSVSSAGGTLSFFENGPEGTRVAEITITIGGNGSRTTRRTA
jgi:hypothetical protein